MSDRPIPPDDARKRKKKRVGDAIDSAAPAKLEDGGGITMTQRGLLLSVEGGGRLLAGPFDLLCETWDDDAQAWGLLLEFADRDGKTQKVVATRDLFVGEALELARLLSRRGLYVRTDRRSVGVFNEYLSKLKSRRRARVISRLGWHEVNGARVFVLPDETFGASSAELIYQPGAMEAPPFRAAGMLDAWRRKIAGAAAGNSRLMLALCCAFSGPLLRLLEEDGGGVHLVGPSRIGKTTALRVAASVWGSGVGGGFIRSWRATSNATESVAAAHSDTLLVLDELGQADARDCGEVAYMLASGQGKDRADRAGSLRARRQFRVGFLSSGEVSLADKIAEAGKRARAGQEVRMIEIVADAGVGHGLFEELHDCESAGALVTVLHDAMVDCYGTAGPAFLRYLCARVDVERGLAGELRRWIVEPVREWLDEYPGATGQVRGVAGRFALLAVAGELATKAGTIVDWDPGDATGAVKVCFDAWLTERGFVGAREDVQAVVQLRDYIGRHSARFEDWDEPEALGEVHFDLKPRDRFRVTDRVGWRKWVDGEWRFYLQPWAMAEAPTGLHQRAAHAVLATREFLVPGAGGKKSKSLKIPGFGQARVYEIRVGIMGAQGVDAEQLATA